MRRAHLLSAGAAMLGALCAPVAFGFDLPAGLPSRAEGLWHIERTETLVHGNTTIEMQKVWNVCLDARADRALHALDVHEQRASVAGLGQICEAPQFALDGNDFSWTMRCPSRHDEARVSDIRHITTFVAPDRAQAETVIVNRGGQVPSQGKFVARMAHLGACEGGMRPGDMLLMHWRINDEETLKARQKHTVYSAIEHYNHRALIVSGRAR